MKTKKKISINSGLVCNYLSVSKSDEKLLLLLKFLGKQIHEKDLQNKSTINRGCVVKK